MYAPMASSTKPPIEIRGPYNPIKTNVSALDAQKNLMGTELDLNNSLAKLSSGFRITKAADDAAGLAILPGLVRYDEAMRGAYCAIKKLRDEGPTARDSAPASHRGRDGRGDRLVV